MTAACGCEKFPLKKGGSAERRRGCLTLPEGQGKGMAAFEIRFAEVGVSSFRETPPRRHSESCSSATAVATQRPPLTKGEFHRRTPRRIRRPAGCRCLALQTHRRLLSWDISWSSGACSATACLASATNWQSESIVVLSRFQLC